MRRSGVDLSEEGYPRTGFCFTMGWDNYSPATHPMTALLLLPRWIWLSCLGPASVRACWPVTVYCRANVRLSRQCDTSQSDHRTSVLGGCPLTLKSDSNETNQEALWPLPQGGCRHPKAKNTPLGAQKPWDEPRVGRARALSSGQAPGQALWVLGMGTLPAAVPLCAGAGRCWQRGTATTDIVKTHFSWGWACSCWTQLQNPSGRWEITTGSCQQQSSNQ